MTEDKVGALEKAEGLGWSVVGKTEDPVVDEDPSNIRKFPHFKVVNGGENLIPEEELPENVKKFPHLRVMKGGKPKKPSA